ncbi:hypothetical protein COT72_02480 [archaeon CG10_big_fil_rev_8_21_14_0_10_43_11]|nr:MAG: hypothetical protein COT72_02480 [archaeon CG10_big_fil_rev_8_21_14_0_10_43_11]
MLLDRIFSNKSRILILREISKSKEGISNSQIAKKTGLSEMAVSRNIRELAQSGIIETKTIGKAILSKINKEHNLGHAIRELFNWESDIQSELSVIVKKHIIQDYPAGLIAIVMFGSRARKTEKLESDLDVMLILNRGERNTKIAFEEGIAVSIFEISKQDFIDQAKQHHPLIMNILLEGEAIYGKKEFKALIKKAGF